MSNDAIVQRLENLRDERAAGQKMLAELDEKRTKLVHTMLRIEGAIQVLEELVAAPPKDASPSQNAAGEPSA